MAKCICPNDHSKFFGNVGKDIYNILQFLNTLSSCPLGTSEEHYEGEKNERGMFTSICKVIKNSCLGHSA